MGHEIEMLDTASAPESVLRELAAYYVIIDREERPSDPATPAAMQIADWRNQPAHQPEPMWVLRDDDQIVATAVAAYDIDQNPENGFGWIHVHPEHRGRGHARRLADPLLSHLEEQRRHRFETAVQVGNPAERLVERLGLKRAITERRSRLQIRELDHDLMRSWISRAGERSDAYELIYFLSPVPEEHLQRFCDLADVMNTAPREDYEMDDEVLTPEMWRDIEQKMHDAQSQVHTLVAVERDSGEFAGFTILKTQDLQPDLAWQWNTGVHPDHRNRGLGRWLKAEMIERIVSAYPRLERLDTYNAGSNRPMLDINIAMGFRPVYEESIWQGDLGKVRAGLGV